MQATDINFSDDELTFLPYLSYIWNTIHTGKDTLGAAFELSMERTFANVQEVRSPLWNFIYLLYKTQMRNASDIPDHILNDAIWTLQTMPIEQIDWPWDNSQRLDVVFDQSVDRFGGSTLRTLVPYDEFSMARWNGDPFTPSGGSGLSTCDGAVYLLPFWLGHYLNYI